MANGPTGAQETCKDPFHDAAPAPVSSKQRAWWRVEVSDHDGQIVAIEPEMLAGRDIGEPEKLAIEHAIANLSGFSCSNLPSFDEIADSYGLKQHERANALRWFLLGSRQQQPGGAGQRIKDWLRSLKRSLSYNGEWKPEDDEISTLILESCSPVETSVSVFDCYPDGSLFQRRNGKVVVMTPDGRTWNELTAEKTEVGRNHDPSGADRSGLRPDLRAQDQQLTPIRDMIEANLRNAPLDPALAKAMNPPPYIDGSWGKAPATLKDVLSEAIAIHHEPDNAGDCLPQFYQPERRCSQCGKPESWISTHGCPEKCGRQPQNGRAE